jgi:hypothetical protein
MKDIASPFKTASYVLVVPGNTIRLSIAIKWQLDVDEWRIIDFCERVGGRKLTPQEINLSLEQARALGEL